MALIRRHLQPRLEEALDAFRVVVVHGARQCGKTTLTRIVTSERGGRYVSLDDPATRGAALADPLTFLTGWSYPLAVDEIQLGGDRLIRMVKRLVDDDPTPGRFLLTGSTNFLTVPTISESLAGRARILRLGPLSEAELAGTASTVVDGWFEPPFGSAPPVTTDRPVTSDRSDYFERVCRGGYPEVMALAPRTRSAWFESYLETVTQRDLVALADIRKVAALPRLLRWAAAGTGKELNLASAARDLGINRRTVQSYLEWLRAVFLVGEVPAWSRNLAPRIGRRPKLHLTDTGLAADLLGAAPGALASPTAPAAGALLESFVVNEIARQAAASVDRMNLSHYRDHSGHGHEVDLVLERPDGTAVAIEVKATSSPAVTQLRSVAWLRDRLDAVSPSAFRAGFLLHTGSHYLTVGDRLHLRPISSLWTAGDPIQLPFAPTGDH